MRTKILSAVAVLFMVPFCPVSANIPESVDWQAFLARQDLVWTRNPASWGDSLFLGNGNLGTTVCVRAKALAWEINRADISHGTWRVPIGKLVLKTAGTLTGGNARLTLWDA